MEKLDKIERLIIKLNNQAIHFAKEINYALAYNHLRQAISLIESQNSVIQAKLTRMTYNNYGLILKQQGDYPKALDYFYKLVDLCKHNPLKQAECYLNICSILSKLSKHSKALKFSLKALKILKEHNSFNVIFAYQNSGSQYEYLGMTLDALKKYKKGYSISKKLFGLDHEFSNMFKNRFIKLSNKLSQNIHTENSEEDKRQKKKNTRNIIAHNKQTNKQK